MYKKQSKQDWDKFIEEIMQDGFDVAMFGDPFMDNVKEKQEKEYNRLVKKHSKFIKKQLTKAREEGRKEGFKDGYLKCWKQVNGEAKRMNTMRQSILDSYADEYLKSLKDKK